MGNVVVRWSGREARALREARRMSVRDFAAHLGVNDSAVSSWERRGARAALRYETQQILDTELASCPPEARERFELILEHDRDDPDPDAVAAADGRGTDRSPAVADAGVFGSSSTSRTRVLLDAVQARRGTRLRYLAPADGALLIDFLSVQSRVFVVTGPPGCGKSALIYHMAGELATRADVQVHAVDSWQSDRLDIPVEILRYASLAAGEDALLTLEQVSERLLRPTVVVIDGVKTRSQLNTIGRQLDAILRQVTSPALRFVVVVRTPPEIDTTAFPVLSASIFEPGSGADGVSLAMVPWSASQAQEVWNLSRNPDESAFGELPVSIQQLARLPLYMQLLRAAGHAGSAGDINPYRLVDYCVRSILRASGHDVDRVIDQVATVSLDEYPDLSAGRALSRGTGGVPPDVGWPSLDSTSARLVEVAPDGRLRFEHDVIHEYFLATRVAALIAENGRSVATVGAFNEIAGRATTSAMARGVFEFVVFRLDDCAPDVAMAIASAPTINVGTTLPLMFTVTAGGARFATDDLLRSLARRCTQDAAVELARSLLAAAAIPRVLGDGHAGWLTGLLCEFGSQIWPTVAAHVEEMLDAQTAERLLASADLQRADVAIFFARYFFLFLADIRDQGESLEVLVAHRDWRVRAALADGLADRRAVTSDVAQAIPERLVRDEDYKVRAALATAIGGDLHAFPTRHTRALLSDSNWHVRARLLQTILSGSLARRSSTDIVALLASTSGWQHCPAHVRMLRERALLLHDGGRTDAGSDAYDLALFALLREARTGWAPLPDSARDRLVNQGARSADWLVRREAHAMSGDRRASDRTLLDARSTFRRLRGRRSIQIALDLHDLDHALLVAKAAVEAGADFIEVGDPLIKHVGIGAVRRMKQELPDAQIVAEMMSADWGRDQVELAARSGADVVLLIGPAAAASVAAAVGAGRRLGVPILLDVPASHATQHWVRDMERAGVDGFTITTNIDLGVGTAHPLAAARALRTWTQLPVAVSGGFSTTDRGVLQSRDWDILIVGRSVSEAVDPAEAARHLVDVIREHPTARDDT